MVRVSPVSMIRSVGRSSATEPAAIDLPSPQSTCPRGPFARNGPNWYCARRSIAGPAMMFSETACSMNRFGPMIGMGVGEDHRRNGTHATIPEIELHRGPRAFDRGQRIHHDDALVALDQRHVGDVEPAHLIDARHHLEQAMMHIEARLAPKAGVHRRRRLSLRQEAVRFEAPDHPALRRDYLRVVNGADKAARGIREIGGIAERQSLTHGFMLRNDRARGLLWTVRRRRTDGACLGHAVLPVYG